MGLKDVPRRIADRMKPRPPVTTLDEMDARNLKYRRRLREGSTPGMYEEEVRRIREGEKK